MIEGAPSWMPANAGIGNWFGAGSDRAAFDAARNMQTAIFQMGPTSSTSVSDPIWDVYRGFGGAIEDSATGTDRLVFDPRANNELMAHPFEAFKAAGQDLIETDFGMVSGDTEKLGRGLGMLTVGRLGDVGLESTGLTDAGFRAASIEGRQFVNLAQVRAAYVAEVRSLQELGLAARAAGATPQATARLLVGERNLLKVKYRALSPPEAVRAFEERNLLKYGDPL